MRREEGVTVQGPVKEQQPDGMSHRGGGGGRGGAVTGRPAISSAARTYTQRLFSVCVLWAKLSGGGGALNTTSPNPMPFPYPPHLSHSGLRLFAPPSVAPSLGPQPPGLARGTGGALGPFARLAPLQRKRPHMTWEDRVDDYKKKLFGSGFTNEQVALMLARYPHVPKAAMNRKVAPHPLPPEPSAHVVPRAVLKTPNFFLLSTAHQDSPQGAPTANRQPPPTDNCHQPPTVVQ